MGFFSGEGFKEGFMVLALATWAAITLTLMLIRSWTAGNDYWVAIFAGLISLSTAFCVYVWRVLVLDQKGDGVDGKQ